MSILLGFLVGIALPVQTSINTKLREKLGSSYNASQVSFIVAFIFLLGVSFINGKNIAIPYEKLIQEPIWIWTGGICGVIFLTGNIFLLSKLGSIQMVIFPVLGQILMGLIIDNYGLFYANQSKLTFLRMIGAVAVVIGVIVISLAKEVKKDELSAKVKEFEDVVEEDIKEDKTIIKYLYLWIWRIFGVIIGMLSAIQIAVNGYLSKVVESPIKSSLISFAVGIILLAVICIIAQKKSNSKVIPSKNKSQRYSWWIWLGGILGGIYILANIYLSGIIGTGMTVIVLLVGATIGGLIIDNFGLFDMENKPVNAIKILGVIIMLAGAVAIKLF